MKKNIIINGNSIEEMNKMEPNSVDLIFADPPYWMRVEGVLKRVEGTYCDVCDDEWDQFESLEDYEKFTTEWLTACYRILKPNGSIWVIGGMQCIYTIGAIMLCHKFIFSFSTSDNMILLLSITSNISSLLKFLATS